MGTMDRDGRRPMDSPEDEAGAIDQAEDSFALDETDEAAAAEYFGDSIEGPERPGSDDGQAGIAEAVGAVKPPIRDGYGAPLGYSANPPKLRESMTPDPKPDSYYAGGLGMAPPPAALVLEKIRIGLKTYVSPAVLAQMKFATKYDPFTDKIMMELGMYLFSNKIHTETTKGDYPAGWFQGFKDAYFPGWLKRKFPVKYTQFFEEVKTIHVCPHLNYRTRDEEKFHLQFLMPEGDLSRLQS